MKKTQQPPMSFLYYLTSELWHGLVQHKTMTLAGVLCAMFLRIGFCLNNHAVIHIPEYLLPFEYIAKGALGAIGVILINKRTVYMSWVKAKARYHYSKLFKND
jgi:hypothetical protein